MEEHVQTVTKCPECLCATNTSQSPPHYGLGVELYHISQLFNHNHLVEVLEIQQQGPSFYR